VTNAAMCWLQRLMTPHYEGYLGNDAVTCFMQGGPEGKSGRQSCVKHGSET